MRMPAGLKSMSLVWLSLSRRIGDQPLSNAERQRRHRAKMAARRALVTRTQIDPPVPVDPVLAAHAMTASEMSAFFGGLKVMSEAELAALQAITGGSHSADYDPDAEGEDDL
jgi:hypothetical protein